MGRSCSSQPMILICSNKGGFIIPSPPTLRVHGCVFSVQVLEGVSLPDEADRSSCCPVLSTSAVSWKQEASDWRTSFESRSANKRTRTSMNKNRKRWWGGGGVERVSQCWAVKDRERERWHQFCVLVLSSVVLLLYMSLSFYSRKYSDWTLCLFEEDHKTERNIPLCKKTKNKKTSLTFPFRQRGKAGWGRETVSMSKQLYGHFLKSASGSDVQVTVKTRLRTCSNI